MCLYYDSKSTESLRDKLRSGPVVFKKQYRVVIRDGVRKLQAPVQGCLAVIAEDGTITSDRIGISLRDDEESSNQVYKGIHVHCESLDDSYSTCIFVDVIGTVDDFVGASSNQAVFTKVRVVDMGLLRERMNRVSTGDDEDDDGEEFDDEDDWDDDEDEDEDDYEDEDEDDDDEDEDEDEDD